jgi:asparagine synthase (glutamine-hydrolysing)
MARAAAFMPELAPAMAQALELQIKAFLRATSRGLGIHFFSGQEIALRILAWFFALETLLADRHDLKRIVAAFALTGARQIKNTIEYAERAVYNNHLIAEALGLFAVGDVFREIPAADAWRRRGLAILEDQAARQFYRDGAYLYNSHNYHRASLQHLLWAWAFVKRRGDRPPAAWNEAIERSLSFLLAHQNPLDGHLPNFGANDGSLPYPLTSCAFGDFRPVLQMASLAIRGERVFEPGPWDEEAAWLLGPAELRAPLRRLDRSSVSLSGSGYYVLRGRDPSNFCTMRCGSLKDRFGHMDMLHVDVWWHGLNVVVDGGSFQYNGEGPWNAHFTGAGSHNTIMLDGHDQMLHYRRFKVLYRTRARELVFADDGSRALCSGEHYGFVRHAGKCIHRRSLLFVKDDLWVVVDRVRGSGRHDVRLQWLCGAFPYTRSARDGGVVLSTPVGQFTIGVYDGNARPVAATVVAGQVDPPRGWISRTYGERVPAPSLVVDRVLDAPGTLVSVLGHDVARVEKESGIWTIETGDCSVRFEILDHSVAEGLIALLPGPPSSGRR